MRMRPAAAVFGVLLLTGGCGSEDGAHIPTAPPTPAPPPAPESPPPPPTGPPPPPDRVMLRPGGVFYAPHQVTELTPGASVQIEVTARPPTFYLSPDWIARTPDWANFSVETDAPPGVLRVRRWIERREVELLPSDTDELETRSVAVGVVELHAIESGAGEPAQAVHQVRIGAPAGGFSGPFEIEVDRTALLFRIVPPTPAVPCEELVLNARSDSGSHEPGRFFRRLFEDAEEFRSGRITIQAPGFGIGLRLVAPYRLRGGELTDAAWDPSAQRQADEVGSPFLFVAGMDLRPVGSGFEQTFDLGWFDELEFLAHAPGCASRRIRCDAHGVCFTE